MFAVSGRHLFAYRGLRIDLEYFLQRIVFGRRRGCRSLDESSGVAALYGTACDTNEHVAAVWQNVAGATVSLLFQNGGTTQMNSAQARKSTVC